MTTPQVVTSRDDPDWGVNSTTTSEVFFNATDVSSGFGLFYVPTELVVLLSLLYGSISAVTVFGNVLVILVIVKNRRMQTVTNFFIANLSVADVMIGLLSTPFQFQAALLQRWDLPLILCPVAPFVKELSVNVSISTLAVISIDRFFAVVHPLRPGWSARTAIIIMGIVWTVGVGSSVPTAVAHSVIWIQVGQSPTTLKPYCYPDFPKVGDVDVSQVYGLYLVVAQYFLPLLVISYAYCRIMYRIWFAKAPGSALDTRDKIMNKNKKKVIKMLIVVVVLFASCWLPLQIYHFLSITVPEINEYKFINIIWFCSNWLAMSNSCYNPFIYGLLNEKFKHGFRQLFLRSQCQSHCRRKDLPDDPFAADVSGVSLRQTYSATCNANLTTTRLHSSWRSGDEVPLATKRSYV